MPYPLSALPELVTPVNDDTPQAPDHPISHNTIAEHFDALNDELGASPKGSATDLTERLEDIDASMGVLTAADNVFTAHVADTTSVHGITDTATVVTAPDQPGLQIYNQTDDPEVVGSIWVNPDAPAAPGYGHDSTDRIETMPFYAGNSSIAPSSGNIYFSYFTPDHSLTVSKLGVQSGGSSAATGTTLGKLALFTVDSGTGDLTRVKVTSNQTGLLSTVDTAYEYAFSGADTYNLVVGTRYAIGLLLVGNTNGQFKGMTNAGAYRLTPRCSGRDDSQTDIGTSYPVSGFNETANVGWFWAAV